MRFSVFALSSVPDTATTRQLFKLEDLDDRSVSKVMFHRRKQQTGSNETLRWDQRVIAGLTSISHSADGLRMDSLSMPADDEIDMLHAFFASVIAHDRVLSWGGEAFGIPLVHFRAIKHTVSFPAYWQALEEGKGPHLDLRSWLSPAGADLPTLNDTARKLGFPGLLGRSHDGVIDAWLADRPDEAGAFSDIAALNTYLLALRMLTVTGEVGHQEQAAALQRLRELLKGRDEPYLAEFLSALGND